MKRIVFIFLFLAIVFTSYGCRSSNDKDYTIYEKAQTFYDEEQKEFLVKYAQVSGISNKRLEEKINAALESSVTEWINDSCWWMGKCQMEVKLKPQDIYPYAIRLNGKMTEKALSVPLFVLELRLILKKAREYIWTI